MAEMTEVAVPAAQAASRRGDVHACALAEHRMTQTSLTDLGTFSNNRATRRGSYGGHKRIRGVPVPDSTGRSLSNSHLGVPDGSCPKWRLLPQLLLLGLLRSDRVGKSAHVA